MRLVWVKKEPAQPGKAVQAKWMTRREMAKPANNHRRSPFGDTSQSRVKQEARLGGVSKDEAEWLAVERCSIS